MEETQKDNTSTLLFLITLGIGILIWLNWYSYVIEYDVEDNTSSYYRINNFTKSACLVLEELDETAANNGQLKINLSDCVDFSTL